MSDRFRILVCGGRNYADWSTVANTLDAIYKLYLRGIELCTGGQHGADELAWKWATRNNVPCRQMYAAWGEQGRSAGPIRNKRMLDEFKPQLVVAFPGGRGTRNMVKLAKEAGVPVRFIEGAAAA